MRTIAWLDRIAVAAALVCPVFLLHGRAGAEIAIDVADLCFLARCALARDWSWLRTRWVWAAGAWWMWLLVCSVPWVGQVPGHGGWHSVAEAAAVARLLLFPAALEHLALRAPGPRRALGWLVSLSALYIAVQSTVQFATGHNLFGDGRGPAGELTGPYDKPRAAAPYSRLLFPALLPVTSRLLARRAWVPRAGAVLLTLYSLWIMVMMGERMPTLLVGLGLLVSALLLPRLRRLALAACVAVAVLIPASAVISPPAFNRLVTSFAYQMRYFPESPYGLIAARAVAMVQANPWTGLGFDGFRTECADPAYFRWWPEILSGRKPPQNTGNRIFDWFARGGGAEICVQHPHNHYLQAAVEGGLPGLLLFCLMVGAWLLAVGRGLWRRPDPLQAGLFVAVLLQEWPIASASDFVNMPLGGWFFLLLGFGLAQGRHGARGAAAHPGARDASPAGGGVAGPGVAPYICVERATAEE